MNTSDLITIAPNPAREKLNIFIEGHNEFSYQFVNLTGQLMLDGMSESAAAIDVSKLSPGIYYGILKYAGKKSMIKFVKE